MGNGSWDTDRWTTYATTNVVGQSRSQIFSSSMKDEVNPLKFTNGIRESVDSVDNPNSTPVAIFTDCTGSMGQLAFTVVQKLDVVCQELLDRSPVSDVHLMTGVIGDAYSDNCPFQATQFEADIRIAEQTQLLYLEGNGGGNGGESYALAWLFAGMQTSIDSYNKRQKKGYIFTVGDEPVHGVAGWDRGRTWGVTKQQAKDFLGLDIERDLTAQECLDLAKEKWNVFHIVVGNKYQHQEGIEYTFGKIMPDKLLYLEDISVLPELIVSAIQVNEGELLNTVASSWDSSSDVITKALSAIVVNKSDDESAVIIGN